MPSTPQRAPGRGAQRRQKKSHTLRRGGSCLKRPLHIKHRREPQECAQPLLSQSGLGSSSHGPCPKQPGVPWLDSCPPPPHKMLPQHPAGWGNPPGSPPGEVPRRRHPRSALQQCPAAAPRTRLRVQRLLHASPAADSLQAWQPALVPSAHRAARLGRARAPLAPAAAAAAALPAGRTGGRQLTLTRCFARRVGRVQAALVLVISHHALQQGTRRPGVRPRRA